MKTVAKPEKHQWQYSTLMPPIGLLLENRTARPFYDQRKMFSAFTLISFTCKLKTTHTAHTYRQANGTHP
jgi:hypothetical protein